MLGATYQPLVRIHLGPPAVSPHGTFTSAGFLVGARLLLVDTRRRGIPDDDIDAILTRAGIGAPVGASPVIRPLVLTARIGLAVHRLTLAWSTRRTALSGSIQAQRTEQR